MLQRWAIPVTFILGSLFGLASCTKTDEGSRNFKLAGDWTSHNQEASSFSIDGTPGLYRSTYVTTSDKTQVHFDGKGHFVFSNFAGTSTGTYQFNESDSLITISPDSSAFLNYCYLNVPVTFYTGNISPPPTPLVHTPGVLYLGYRGKDSLSILAGYINPDTPFGDSIIVVGTGFVRL